MCIYIYTCMYVHTYIYMLPGNNLCCRGFLLQLPIGKPTGIIMLSIVWPFSANTTPKSLGWGGSGTIL